MPPIVWLTFWAGPVAEAREVRAVRAARAAETAAGVGSNLAPEKCSM